MAVKREEYAGNTPRRKVSSKRFWFYCIKSGPDELTRAESGRWTGHRQYERCMQITVPGQLSIPSQSICRKIAILKKQAGYYNPALSLLFIVIFRRTQITFQIDSKAFIHKISNSFELSEKIHIKRKSISAHHYSDQTRTCLFSPGKILLIARKRLFFSRGCESPRV